MWARFDAIRLDPQRYRQRADLFPGCRIAAEGKHVILFKFGPDSPEIIRVLHAAMDFKTQLAVNDANPSGIIHFLSEKINWREFVSGRLRCGMEDKR